MIYLFHEAFYLSLLVLLVILTFFILQRSSIFKPNYEVETDTLKINKFLFPSTILHFDKIRRVIIRKMEDVDGIPYIKITIFGKQKNAHINFEHLREYSKFQQMIEAKGAVFNFKVIHQDTQGGVI